ncbi:unnamed protein product [Rotaria sp. Silwood1]|nr:unnamed protein product [Rotaria sp. Silwood1]
MEHSLVLIASFLVLLCNANVIHRNQETIQTPATGAPNLFNLPNLSKNTRTDINLVEGDIAIPADKNRIAFTEFGPWPGGVVPYTLHNYFSAGHRTMITDAMRKISELTNNCIRFVDRGSNRAWLNIHPGEGCWSYMGKTISSGAQDFSLELPGCLHRGNVSEPQPAIVDKSITTKTFNILVGLLVLFSITTIVLGAIALGILINRINSRDTTSSLNNSGLLSFADQIKIDDLLHHLEQLQLIADQSNGTQAIGTRGFNDTFDYITEQLEQNTNLIVQHEYFIVKNCAVQGTPQLQSQINGLVEDHVYLTDFTHVLFTPGANFDSFVRLVPIPNLGCQNSDWMNVSVTDSIALVKRGV